jgi:ribosomal protein S18 acetylase RimI-like enzyme
MSEIILKNLHEGDLQEVARIHLAAFPKSAIGQLGDEAVKRYYRWQLQGPHDVIALGTFCEEKLTGFCFAGIFRGSLSGFLQKNKAFLAWRVITHPWLAATPLFRERIRSASIILIKRPEVVAPQKSFGVLSIAVDPEWQGAGVGKRLMLEVERIARDRDFLNMHLTVGIDNMQAIKFYEKLGWCKVLAQDGKWRGAMAKHIE